MIATSVGIAPEDGGFRRLNGEARDAKAGWILVETKRARERRPKLRRVAREAVARHAGSTKAAATAEESRCGVRWSAVRRGRNVRVLSAVDDHEADLAVRESDATWPVFEAVFGLHPVHSQKHPRYLTGLTIYSLPSREQGNGVLADLGVGGRELEFAAPLAITWIRGRRAVVIKSPDKDLRLEGGPWAVAGAHAATRFGIAAHRAWAAEGIQHYLTWLINGTRLIYRVADKPDRYAKGRPGIPDYAAHIHSGREWMTAGRLLLDSPDKPSIHLMAGKSVNKITTAEMLYGYCIVAYLIEGEPAGWLELLSGVGGVEGANLEGLLLAHLHVNAATFEQRLRRWMLEMKDVPE
jgi:hypothetical protein